MSLSDHVVVMNDGRVEQQGPPHEIYEQPASQFVAGFIGTTNFVPGQVQEVSPAEVTVQALGRTIRIAPPEGRSLQANQSVQLVIRPEHLRIGQAHSADALDSGGNNLQARVTGISYLGYGKNSDGVPLADAFALLEPTAIRLNLDIKETKVLGALHDLLVEYNLYDRVVLTGLEVWNMNAVKASTCRDLPYYLNYIPSRFQIFSADYQQRLLKILEESGAIGLNCNYKHVGGRLSNFLHKNGYKLSVWTVDRRDTMKRILVAKPDNITTKQYDKLQDVIARWGKNK